MDIISALAGLLILVGLILVWRSGKSWSRELHRPAEDLHRVLKMVVAFRIGIIGLAITGIGIWFLTGQLWILVVSLCVGGEELLESSFIIWAMKSDPRSANKSTLSQHEPSQASG